MPTETPKAKAAPPPTAAEQATTTKEEAAVTGAGHKDSSNDNNRNSGGGSGGSRGWRSRLMNWRTAGGDSSSSTAEDVKGGDTTTAPAAPAAAAAQGGKAETAQEKEGGTLEKGADKAASAAAPPRPMNIWLRRAIERQAESAIAEAIRDGKPIPAAAVAAVAAAEAAAAAAKSAKNSAEAATASTTTTDADATAAAVAPKVVTFADLMRQHREGTLAPVAQPPVKTTTVVKKPKTTKVAAEHQSETSAAAAAAAAEAPATTPTAKKRKTKTTSESAEVKENTTTATAATTATTGAVHQGVVRKRLKASSSSSTALNSASVKPIQESNAAATPTRTITVKGKVSLEELRARRNRTAGGSAHSTLSTPSGTGDAAVAPKGIAGKDGYNERALDAISQLLLRYCLANLTPSPVAKTTAESAAPAKKAGNQEEALATTGAATTENGAALTTATTSELAFLDQLMEQFETHSLTPASLELLRELLQHVRVLPRPATTAAANSSGTVEKEGEPNTAATSALAATAAETAAVDTEAYREALRRREYVQQVIMVLINQLRQLKLREQQQRQDYETAAAATTAAVVSTESNGNDATGTAAVASAVAPQPVIGHAMPSIKVGGRPLNPLPIGASAPRGNAQQQQQQQQPCTLAYDEQTRRVAEIAAGSAAEDETMAAAAFASMMAAYGHMNPYAHLTVFSQHQPVVPPVGWGSFATSRSSSGSMGARCGCDEPPASTHSSSSQHTHLNNNVAARLMPSPFPGAFPIIPPPPPSFASHGGDDGVTTTTTAKEDREMQELFRVIRRQLTQPVHHGSQGTPVSVAATAYPSAVDVSQAERAILRHVQEDFKKQQQQQQQVSIGSSPAPQAPPSASTPLAASLDASANQAAATSHRSLFTPQGKQQSPRKEVEAEAEQGASPPARSTTVTAAEAAAAAAKDDEKPSVTSASASRTLNFEAKPFVPAQAIATVSAAESTPRKTTFNYMAAPFIPGNKAASSSESNCGAATSAAPATRKSIRFEAMPFVPHSGAAATTDNSCTNGISNSNNRKSSTGAHVANTSSQMNAHAQPFVPASAPQRAVASISTPTQGSRSHHPAGGAQAIAFEDASELVNTATDPWASYEMFARWRDIMESYYQSLFAAQHVAGVSSAFTRPPRRM
ncbi:hypothetical protein N2W54_000012 [Lotmaria passim]